jgi:hypothetical protein
MANNNIVNDLNRLERGLTQRASKWQPIYKALADAETAAWQRFTAVLRKTGLDATWESTRTYVTGWPAEAFENIRVGEIRAHQLEGVFISPLKIGLKMLIYGALREKPDYAHWGFWANSPYDVEVRAFFWLPELMEKQMTAGASVAAELRRLSQHVASLAEGVSIHDATAGMLAMLYSPVFYPNVVLPDRLALSIEVHLWGHYLAYLTGLPIEALQYVKGSGVSWRDLSPIYDRLREFGWNRIAADFSDDIATVRARLKVWCERQISRPLEIELRFPPSVISYIHNFNNRADLVHFLKQPGLSWSDAGI